MDLYVLDSDFHPATLIEGYETLIWTERYDVAGDFVLTTAKIQDTMTKMPIDSFVAVNDSKELMCVENFLITQNEDGVEILEVSGRTFETVYERRTTITTSSTYPGFSPITNPTTGENNALILGNGSSAFHALTALTAFSGLGKIDTRDSMSPHTVVNRATGTLSSSSRFLERGNAYDVALNLLKEDNLGIRNVRPNQLFDYVTTEIYNGVSRTTTVIFDAKAGHFKKAKYLISGKNQKNVVYVASQKNFRQVIATGASGYTGLQRKVGSLELPEITQTGTTINSALDAKGRSYLSKNKKLTLVEGDVSPNAPYEYGVDYKLGDTVLCKGNYGVSSNLMVNEYVRIKDKNGESGYPLLSAV